MAFLEGQSSIHQSVWWCGQIQKSINGGSAVGTVDWNFLCSELTGSLCKHQSACPVSSSTESFFLYTETLAASLHHHLTFGSHGNHFYRTMEGNFLCSQPQLTGSLSSLSSWTKSLFGHRALDGGHQWNPYGTVEFPL